MNQIDTSKQPSWLELPEEERKLWTTNGSDDLDKRRSWFKGIFTKKKNFFENHWLVMNTTKEEAEAYALSGGAAYNWKWDGKPAYTLPLQDVIREARQKALSGDGCMGVRVNAYQNGRWVEIARYPVDVPYVEGQ